jgi:hypothetical protein
MADYTIAADEIGAYEIKLTANTPVTIVFEAQAVRAGTTAHITVHDANTPVYARAGSTVTPRDPHAVMTDSGSWVGLPVSDRDGGPVAIVCASDALVSVARS